MKKLLFVPLLLILSAVRLVPAQACCSITIAGSSAVVRVTTSSTSVNWVQLVAPTGNASTAYWGIGTTSTANGGILPAGSGQFIPPKARGNYDLSNVYVYVASGDTLRVAWDQ